MNFILHYLIKVLCSEGTPPPKKNTYWDPVRPEDSPFWVPVPTVMHKFPNAYVGGNPLVCLVYSGFVLAQWLLLISKIVVRKGEGKSCLLC